MGAAAIASTLALKFFLYTFAGSTLMVVGILAVYFASAPHTFDITEFGEAVGEF